MNNENHKEKLEDPIDPIKLNEAVAGLSPENRLRHFINQTKKVVQSSIEKHKDELQKFRKNPEKTAQEILGSEQAWIALSPEEKKRIFTLFEDQICLNLFATQSDFKQLDSCLKLIPISMAHAYSMYSEVIASISDPEPNVEKKLTQIEKIKKFLDHIQQFSCENSSEQQSMTGLVREYKCAFGKEPPLQWLIKESGTFKETITTFYVTGLSVLVTKIQFIVSAPEIHRDIMQNGILRKKLESVVSENKAYLEDIFPSKSVVSQIINWGKNVFATPESNHSSTNENNNRTNTNSPESFSGSSTSNTSSSSSTSNTFNS